MNEIIEEERDGEKVVVINSNLFKNVLASKKQKLLMGNGIDMKYLPKIHSTKRNYTFKFVNISSIEDLKIIIELQKKMEIFSYLNTFYDDLIKQIKKGAKNFGDFSFLDNYVRSEKDIQDLKNQIYSLDKLEIEQLMKIKDMSDDTNSTELIKIAESLNILEVIERHPEMYLKKLTIFSTILGLSNNFKDLVEV